MRKSKSWSNNYLLRPHLLAHFNRKQCYEIWYLYVTVLCTTRLVGWGLNKIEAMIRVKVQHNGK